MGSSPSPPPAPDPAQTAAAQGAWNFATGQEQQFMNNTNQQTPYGSVNYAETGGKWIHTPSGDQYVPSYTATTALSPGMQKLFDTTLGNSQLSADTATSLGHSVQDMLSKNVDLGPSATSAYLDKLNTQTLDPQWQHSQQALDQQLANQGLTPGSDGWKYAQTQFGLNKDNAYNSMYLQGHNTATQDIMSQYNEPLNALNALKSGAQVNQPGIGQLAPTAQTALQPPNYESIVQSNYNNATQQYAADSQRQGQMMGGLMGLGGSLLGGLFQSDRRDKTDIDKLGTDPASNLPMYSYRYKTDPDNAQKTVGPIAQDVEKQYPGTTADIGGHKVINRNLLAAALANNNQKG